MPKLMKSSPSMKSLESTLINLPSPSSISHMWNFGSHLGITLVIQILTGMTLAMMYNPSSVTTFSSMADSMRNVEQAWLLKYSHMMGASMMFIMIYMHIARNIYFNLQKNKMAWTSGFIILILLMATAFLGYILPWGQMSLWGATVITNLLTAVPYVGDMLVITLWGGFALGPPTLLRFFSLHLILPFVIMATVIIHLIYIHHKGSNNPMGTNSNMDKIPFNPFFTLKDMVSYTLMISILMTMTLINPNFINDPENFMMANPMMAPEHIQPEWYFLFAYAILRSIPNKMLGIVALALAISILMIPMFIPSAKWNSSSFYPPSKLMFWSFINTCIILTWVGAKPIEDPYITISQITAMLYFITFMAIFYSKILWDKWIQ